MKEYEVKSIRNGFTLSLKGYGFKGRDYANITRDMKKWLALDPNETKWNNAVYLIATAELRAIDIMKKIKLKNRFMAEIACWLACRSCK